MIYKKDKLGNYIDILSGFAFKSKDFVKEGIPLIKIKNITPPNVSLVELSYISSKMLNNYEKYVLSYDDVLIALTGSHINQWESVVGRVARVKYKEKSLLNQRVGKIFVRKNVEADLDYIYYFLSQDVVKLQLANKAGGAANQANISSLDIKNLEFPCPNVKIQRKISKILKTYDDLIENNQKQIKLLEEAAQRLYKEWFVDLRFPGYENTPIIDGVPEGWSFQKIGKVFEIKYGKTLSMNNILNKGKYPVYGANGVIGYYNQKNCNDYVVLITSRGNGSGEVSRTHDKEAFVTNNSFIIMPVNDLIKLPFTYQLMKTINFKRICTGSAQPQLTNKSINILKVVLPSDELVLKFCQYTEIYYEKIENLLSQNKRLIEARDRLLTKLMSGEIEV